MSRSSRAWCLPLMVIIFTQTVPQSVFCMYSVSLCGQASGFLSIWLGDQHDGAAAATSVVDRVQLDEASPTKEITVSVKTNFMRWNVSAKVDVEGSSGNGELNHIDFECQSAEPAVSTLAAGSLAKMRTTTVIASGTAPTAQQGSRLKIRYNLNKEKTSKYTVAIVQYRLEAQP